MFIVVPIKIVPDYKARLTLNATQTGIAMQGVTMMINPLDAIALQAAVTIKKKHPQTNITALFIAPETAKPQITESLALGADQAIHITTDETHSSLSIAKIIKKVIEQQAQVDLVLMGKQAIDTDACQTPQMLGALLDWPTVCFISKLDIDCKNRQLQADCEWDDGIVKATTSLPAVISCDLRLNTPSPASIMAILKAKQKSIQTIALPTLSLALTNNQPILKLEKPPKRAAPKKIQSIDELVCIIQQSKDDR
jgi:electron transfer flavoprotein beta subunit